MQSAPDRVTVGRAYRAAGAKPFDAFGVSALIRYHLQIAAVFALQGGRDRCHDSGAQKVKAFRGAGVKHVNLSRQNI